MLLRMVHYAYDGYIRLHSLARLGRLSSQRLAIPAMPHALSIVVSVPLTRCPGQSSFFFISRMITACTEDKRTCTMRNLSRSFECKIPRSSLRSSRNFSHLLSWRAPPQVILCACLGLGAQAIVPTAEAWLAAAPPLQGRGSALAPTAPRRGAISYAPSAHHGGGYVVSTGRGGRWQQRWPSAGAISAVAGGSGGGWGSAAAATPAAATTTASRRLPRSASVFSRGSSWARRPVAGAGGAAGGGVAGGGRGRVAVMMSMAEEEREGSNAVFGALALAGLGAVYYG